MSTVRSIAKLQTRVMAFSCPPERLLREAARNVVQHQNVRLNSTAVGSYLASECAELEKPLQIKSVPSQSPGEGEIRVGIHHAGINFADILVCQGKYQNKPALPFTPGNEIAGEVLEVGEGVNHLKVGDRVFAMCPDNGGFAQEVVTPAQIVGKLPPTVSYEKAASFLCNYGTAWLGLTRQANIKPGQTVLVTAAAGGVGLAAVDLAKNVFGCTVIGACGGPEKCELVKQRGAIECIDYNKESIRERMKEITDGNGADIIFEVCGGKIFDESLRSIAIEGTMLVIGFASGPIPKIPANYLLLKSCKVVGVFWGSYSFRNPPVFLNSMETVAGYLGEGKINPHVSKIFPLSQINESFQYVLDRKSTGKVVISMRD